MTARRIQSFLLVTLILAGRPEGRPARAGDDAPATSRPDQRFSDLLDKAKKGDKEVDWTALRHAYAESSRYQPYGASWREELTKVDREMKSGDLKSAEAGLVKLMDREQFMRIDAHAVASALYRKTGQKDKERLHRRFMQGLVGALLVPEHGTSFEKPIEVLFIEEEYLVLRLLKYKTKRRGHVKHGGHDFDVWTLEAQDGEPEREFYFNIDLPQKALRQMLQPAVAPVKKK